MRWLMVWIRLSACKSSRWIRRSSIIRVNQTKLLRSPERIRRDAVKSLGHVSLSQSASQVFQGLICWLAYVFPGSAALGAHVVCLFSRRDDYRYLMAYRSQCSPDLF